MIPSDNLPSSQSTHTVDSFKTAFEKAASKENQSKVFGKKYMYLTANRDGKLEFKAMSRIEALKATIFGNGEQITKVTSKMLGEMEKELKNVENVNKSSVENIGKNAKQIASGRFSTDKAQKAFKAARGQVIKEAPVVVERRIQLQDFKSQCLENKSVLTKLIGIDEEKLSDLLSDYRKYLAANKKTIDFLNDRGIDQAHETNFQDVYKLNRLVDFIEQNFYSITNLPGNNIVEKLQNLKEIKEKEGKSLEGQNPAIERLISNFNRLKSAEDKQNFEDQLDSNMKELFKQVLKLKSEIKAIDEGIRAFKRAGDAIAIGKKPKEDIQNELVSNLKEFTDQLNKEISGIEKSSQTLPEEQQGQLNKLKDEIARNLKEITELCGNIPLTGEDKQKIMKLRDITKACIQDLGKFYPEFGIQFTSLKSNFVQKFIQFDKKVGTYKASIADTSQPKTQATAPAASSTIPNNNSHFVTMSHLDNTYGGSPEVVCDVVHVDEKKRFGFIADGAGHNNRQMAGVMQNIFRKFAGHYSKGFPHPSSNEIIDVYKKFVIYQLENLQDLIIKDDSKVNGQYSMMDNEGYKPAFGFMQVVDVNGKPHLISALFDDVAIVIKKADGTYEFKLVNKNRRDQPLGGIGADQTKQTKVKDCVEITALDEGDVVMAFSDGYGEFLTESELKAVLDNNKDPSNLAKELEAEIEKQAKADQNNRGTYGANGRRLKVLDRDPKNTAQHDDTSFLILPVGVSKKQAVPNDQKTAASVATSGTSTAATHDKQGSSSYESLVGSAALDTGQFVQKTSSAAELSPKMNLNLARNLVDYVLNYESGLPDKVVEEIAEDLRKLPREVAEKLNRANNTPWLTQAQTHKAFVNYFLPVLTSGDIEIIKETMKKTLLEKYPDGTFDDFFPQ